MSAHTIVWDLGGVVVRWEPVVLVREALAHLALDEPAGAALAASFFQDFGPEGDWSQFDRGTVDVDTLAGRMASRTGVDRQDVERLLAAVPAHLTVREQTVAVILAMRAQGHRCVYLSNMPAPFAKALDATGNFAGWFDAGVYSCDVGQVKPEPEIFATAQALLGLDPARTTLVDDRQANVDAARAAGWDAVLFTDAAGCARALEAAGLYSGG